MPLGLTAQTSIAFKNLLGKSETYIVNGLSNEEYGIAFNIPSGNVWTNVLGTSATQAVSNGYAIAVTASMTGITNSNGYAYTVNWPEVAPSGIDIATGLTFAYNSGSLNGINSGDVINNAISDYYGTPYTINVMDENGNTILSSDARNWIYQYNSGIYFQEAIASPNPSTASLYVYIGETLESQPNSPFTSASASETTIGGLEEGTIFNNVSVNNVLNNLFYPSLNAEINSFGINSLTSSYEVGNGVSSGSSFVLSWSMSNSSQVSTNGIYIYGTAGTLIFGPTSNSGAISSYSLPNIILTQPFTHTWTLRAVLDNGLNIASEYNINWYYNLFYGATATSNLSGTFSSLQSYTLGASPYGTYNLPGGTTSYKYIVVPDSFSAINAITWKGLPVSMADSSDGFTSSANDIYYRKISYTNPYSVTSNYKIYRTKYMMAATMSNVIIS